jgi:hypothetical protein
VAKNDGANDPDGPTPPAPPAVDPKIEKRDALRAEIAKLASVEVKRAAAVPDTKDVPGSKAHVVATFGGGRKRVSHVVEHPFDLDDAEIAVLTVVLAHHKGS